MAICTEIANQHLGIPQLTIV